MGDVYCNNCGHKNPIGSNFCSSCGAILETESPENTTITFHPTSPVDPVDSGEDDVAGRARRSCRPTSGVLVVKRGQNVGLAVQPHLTRSPPPGATPRATSSSTTSPSRVATPRSSPTAEGFAVRDVGSLNGTYLNRERIDEAPLANGDELQIGKFKLVFLLGRCRFVTERSHLSIGEVLNLLQDEFPDITISKIRFLESQGLLDPERTPSGYRKFYEEDIERLRWILRQQKENFLPLKVIKDRLASGDLDDPAAVEPTAVEPAVVDQAERSGDAAVASVRSIATAPPPERTREPVAVGEVERPARRSTNPGRGRSRTERSTVSSGGAETVVPPVSTDAPSLLETGVSGVSLTRDEVLGATGLSASDLADLERFGLVESHTLGNTSYYDDDAVMVARLGATFMGHGVEARHLRMYKVSAEREAGVFEQLVMPLLKQRNPTSRAQATERLDELAVLGGRLRAAMLRQALREHLGG